MLYEQNTIDNNYLDVDGLKHIDKWRSFTNTLSRFHNTNVKKGFGPSRQHYSLIDRTQSIPSIIKTHIDPTQLIPTGPPSGFDFLDICLARANEFLKTGKHINVLWSGGVDSTLVLFSLMRQAQNIDQLSIICTFESIIESGGMFDSIIKNSGIRIKFDQTRCNTNLPYSYDSEDLTQIYITGQCADQLFGAPKFLKPPDDLVIEMPENLKYPWYSIYEQNLLDLVEPTLKFSQRPIETIYDIRWWMLFNYTWTTVLYDDCVDRPVGVANRINCFYATQDFQKWAMHTPTYYENNEEYKGVMKQSLARLMDYPYYIKNKRKTMSYTWHKNKNWFLLDKNFKTYYVDN
jgi:hypothetical protein